MSVIVYAMFIAYIRALNTFLFWYFNFRWLSGKIKTTFTVVSVIELLHLHLMSSLIQVDEV